MKICLSKIVYNSFFFLVLSPRSLRQALHTSIPSVLIGREKEQTFINKFIKKTMIDLQSGSLYLSGAPGTGKTACLTKALDQLEVGLIFFLIIPLTAQN